MSNPGVIILSELKVGTNNFFRVEDNLGEAIHIHYNNIRIDLSINELLDLSKICDESIYDLVGVEEFNLDEYDYDFLINNSYKLVDLKKIEKVTIPVKDLYYIDNNIFKWPVKKSIKNHSLNKSIKRNYQPVIFNDGNVIVYGEDIVSESYFNNSNDEILVYRWIFENNKYSIPKHPTMNHLFVWDKKRIVNTGYKLLKCIFKGNKCTKKSLL